MMTTDLFLHKKCQKKSVKLGAFFGYFFGQNPLKKPSINSFKILKLLEYVNEGSIWIFVIGGMLLRQF